MSTLEDCNLVLLSRSNLNSEGSISKSTSLRLVRGVEPDAESIQPYLTIVVVAYRHENYIEECLASINSTSIESLELIVIDDGSPDKTLLKCLDFQFRLGIKVRVYTKLNQGLVHSLFSGLELAKGRYLSFMASDDLYVKGGLESALNYLQHSKSSVNALLCQAIALESNEKTRLVYGSMMDKFFSGTPFERFDLICTLPPSPMLLQATIFGTAFLRSLKPWADNLALDDWPTFIRLFAAEAHHAAVVRYEPTLKLCIYRINEEGLHNNLDRQLQITAQVATLFVPLRYRKICLANATIGNGLIHIYEGRWGKGAAIFLRGFLINPSFSVFGRLSNRALKFLQKRFRIAINR